MSVLEALLREIVSLKEPDQVRLLAIAQQMGAHGQPQATEAAPNATSHEALRQQGLLEGPPLSATGRQKLGGRFHAWNCDLSVREFATARRDAWSGFPRDLPSERQETS